MGLIAPLVAGEDNGFAGFDEYSGVVPAESTGLPLQPSIRQYLQDLNGASFETADGEVIVETIQDFEGGVTVKPVTFRKPGLGLRYFRLGATPEAAFFFLVVGLTVVSFEFFAIGPGVAAGVAALSLLIGGWGIVNLPVRWWALGLAVIGWGILTVSYQRGGVISLTGAGAVLLQAGGTFFVDGSGQIDPRWWLVLPSVLGVLFFFLLAMPTVQRARFSTQTIGRDGLIGHEGVALVDFDPDGLVEVEGARWRATAHREAGIVQGARVIVTGVDGLFLEIEPLT
jgi:membrane-bound serine protease (ClpP class)